MIRKSNYERLKNCQNIWIDKNNFHKFLFEFQHERKKYRKVFVVKADNRSKIDSIKDAKRAFEDYRLEIEQDYYYDGGAIKLNKLFEFYYSTLDRSKPWTRKKRYIYETYIGYSPKKNEKGKVIDKIPTHIGNKDIDKIREMDVRRILADMAMKEYSPRTMKSILEVLKPMFRFALKNKYIRENPIYDISVKIPSQKRIVTNATDLFTKFYKSIMHVYADDPFNRALFLFALTGRRKSEILNLKWHNIDFLSRYYWIEDTKNGDQQKYPLPTYVSDALSQIEDDREGLVFKSPVTGAVIINLTRRLDKLKEYLGVQNLSMHYMRNILVSMLAEQQIEAIVLSGILGHKDVNTVNKYLSINHYKSGQVGLDKIEDVLEGEILN